MSRSTLSRSAMLATALAAALLAAAPAGCGGSSPRPSGPPPGDPLVDVAGADLYEHGLALADRGDFVRAEQYLVASIERGYPEGRVMPALLRACLASSRMRAALSYAEPYLRRNPAAWSLRLLVATIYQGLGEVERARASLQKVIRDAPDQPDAYYLLGLLQRDELGDRPAAALSFARYLSLAPQGRHAEEVRDALRSLEQAPAPAAGPPPQPAPGISGDAASGATRRGGAR